MKYSLEGLSSRFDPAEEINSKLEDRSIEIMQSEEQKENRVKKINRPSEKCEMLLSIPAYT